jgi:hypothetical protein
METVMAGKAKKKVARKRVAKAAVRRAPVKKAKTAARKKSARREFGEGNYKASKRFRTEEEAFVKRNRSKIPAMGKAAEAELEGPRGAQLMKAAADAASHAAGQD